MKKLQEIVRVVGRKRLKRIEVFNEGRASQKTNLYYKLYHGIKEGKFTTDEEAAKELFDCDSSDKKYLMLKSRVKTRLINSLFFLETTNSNYEQAIYRVNKNYIAAKFLLLSGANTTSIALYRSTLHEAEKFGLTEVAVECLRKLRYLSSFLGKGLDFHKYNELLKAKQPIYLAEIKAEEYISMLTLPFAKSHQRRIELSDEAMSYIRNIEISRESGTSLNLEMHYFRLKALAYQISQDFDKVLDVCDEADGFFDRNPLIAMPVRYGEFVFYRMISSMHLGDYETGKETAAKGLQFFRTGSVNWMIFNEYFFLLCMHTGNYYKAASIYQQVTNHARFEHLDKNRREKWRIFEGFLRYMSAAVNLSIDESITNSGRFNIFKFLNEVPNYSKDKRGLNIAILILQVLFLLDRQDYNGIISRAEALKVYCSRYLKKDEHFRSNCFLKMVLIMEKKDFDKEQTRKIAHKYYTKLTSSKFNYQGGKLTTLEIVPYEQLWKTILAKLKS